MKRPRVLLLGSSGQVGFELLRVLTPGYEVETAGRRDAFHKVDYAHPERLESLVHALAPDLVINAAAYTAVDRAESEPDLALKVNADGPRFLARACAARGITLVHLSTDYVFDGTAPRPYREDDPCQPLGVYGRSKRAGEVAIADSRAHHLILRLQWLYAARGQNFLRTMLRLAAAGKPLAVVADQFGAPTPARWVAAAVALLLPTLRAQTSPRQILHLCAGGVTTWYDFAQAIFAGARERGLLTAQPIVARTTTAAYAAPAPRPANGQLDCTAIAEGFGIALPDWRIGLAQVLDEIASA